MTPEEALQLLRNMAARYQGTLADHQAIQTALGVLAAGVEPPVEDKTETNGAGGNRAERRAAARKPTLAK